ncbi:MAG: fumarylacetoacetate hydrolase family protein [Bacteroidota bacterium]
MKLIRFGVAGKERPGLLTEDGRRLDVSQFGEDFNEHFFASDGPERLKRWISSERDRLVEVAEDVRWASPLARPSKIICIGLNYYKHAVESGMEVPLEPVIFFKSTSSIVGPYDEIIIPKNSKKTDWEVELAVVIGRRASYINKESAMDYIAGYCIHNDVSERSFQLDRGGQWVKGKSADTFAPLGPFLATKEDILEPHNLRLWLKLNGDTVQDSNTSDLIFDIPTIVSHLSEFMTLLPGDVISTGTPAGVGLGLDPPRYLTPGDELELRIEGLGTSKQRVVAYQN